MWDLRGGYLASSSKAASVKNETVGSTRAIERVCRNRCLWPEHETTNGKVVYRIYFAILRDLRSRPLSHPSQQSSPFVLFCKLRECRKVMTVNVDIERSAAPPSLKVSSLD